MVQKHADEIDPFSNLICKVFFSIGQSSFES